MMTSKSKWLTLLTAAILAAALLAVRSSAAAQAYDAKLKCEVAAASQTEDQCIKEADDYLEANNIDPQTEVELISTNERVVTIVQECLNKGWNRFPHHTYARVVLDYQTQQVHVQTVILVKQ